MKTNITRRINSELMFQGRLQRERACLKGVTLCSMGLWLPVWAFHWFRLWQVRSITKYLIDALERAESLKGLV